MAPLKRFDPTDPSNPPAWGPQAWVPGEDAAPTLTELPSTDEWGLSNAPVKKWTNADLVPKSPSVKYSDVSQDPHGPLPSMGGDQNKILADAQKPLGADVTASYLGPLSRVLSAPNTTMPHAPQIGESKTVDGVTGRWDGQGWEPVSEPVSSGPEGVAGAGSMYHPGLGDTPTTAIATELGLTGVQTLKGLARSPLDLISNTVSSLAHPVDTVTGLAGVLRHPLDTAANVAHAAGAD